MSERRHPSPRSFAAGLFALSLLGLPALGLSACGGKSEATGGGDATCEEGFTQDPDDAGSCIDIDECDTGEASCDRHATCENTEGGFDCSCDDGYQGDGVTCTKQQDTGHCLDGCSDNATCKLDGASYVCVCDNGYEGDGVTCDDVNECASAATNDCPGDSTCKDTEGAYECTCPEGYELGATGCEDIDECESNLDDCGSKICNNTPGSFTCGCVAPLIGNDVSCCDPTAGNMALASSGATATATSTYSGYSVGAAIDGNPSTVQSGAMSWCNDWPDQPFPQVYEITFPGTRSFNRVDLYTSDNFPIGDYDIEYFNGAVWQPLAVITGNVDVHRVHTFAPVMATKLRVLGRKGAIQPTYVRLNELEVTCQ